MNDGKMRNRPCPCGSGKKFKHCCLSKPAMPTLKEAQEVSEKDRQTLAAIMDAVMDEYLANHRVVFRSESERKRVFFSQLKARRSDWERSKLCRYPGCMSPSIKRSHTIPRGALSLIAEEGHVLHPEFGMVAGELCMLRVGLNKASTFPGYCELHEINFQKFEADIQISTSTDFALQTYRTLCRVIAILENHLYNFKTTIEDFKKRRKEWGRRRAEELLREAFRVDERFKVRGFEIEVDDALTKTQETQERLERDLAWLKKAFLAPFAEELNSGQPPLVLFHHFVPERLPIALAGQGSFRISGGTHGKKGKVVTCILNVLPTRAGTDIFAAAPGEDQNAVTLCTEQFMREYDEREGILRMIEAWMLHGSDHWFLSPSAWAALSPPRQRAVLDAIMHTTYNIGAQPTVAVLDAARK